MQCKIITGFGKTICQRLEDKLKEHKSKNTEPFKIPVSPVLLPRGQISKQTFNQEISPVKDKVRSNPFVEEENDHHSVEDDYQFALQLSQVQSCRWDFPQHSVMERITNLGT